MSAPSFAAAQAWVSVSSIRLANSGGVNTSSLERLAMQVKTSGLRPRSEKLACLFIWTPPKYCQETNKQAHAQSSACMNNSPRVSYAVNSRDPQQETLAASR